ncbi:MAG TPA: trypsin-like peptidase domain-containing protein [Actinomycetota bacterium]|nr:trypsin-like peptidase domain-containing protein [Actinomycetota bacterium]
MGVLEEIQESVEGIAGQLEGSVVGIGHRWAHGSGIIISDGRVVTNAHNVHGEEVTVSFGDGRSLPGKVAGTDADGDLAVITVDTGESRPLEWGDPGSISIGRPVFAASNPGGRGLRVTFGLVSAVQRSFRGPRGRMIRGAIEHTAPLLPGSSGGPLVDTDGRLLAINTNRLGEGFYLALPADESLQGKVDALGRGQTQRRPRLGIGIAPSHVAKGLRRAVGLPEADGLLVRHVEDDTPAAAAGLSEGDLIVEAGGRTLASVDELYEVLDTAGPELDVTVLHGTEERRLKIALGGKSEE